MKVHLVDGTFELFRCFFGAPKAVDDKGREIGASRGLLNTLISLVRQPDVTHVAVAFDQVIESFRNDDFPGYKTGAGIDSALYSQFGLGIDIARALGFTVWPMIKFEADDAIATAARRFMDAPGVEQVVICSPDKDMGQCVVGDRVIMLDRIRKTTMNEQGVTEKFGVPPAAIPEYLGLVGDAADGLPGIPGWGAKSTATVLAQYGTIEAIPTGAETWAVKVRGAAKLAQTLNERRKEAYLYRNLARLRFDVPLPEEDVDDLRWQGAIKRDLEPIAGRLRETEVLARIPQWREAKAGAKPKR